MFSCYFLKNKKQKTNKTEAAFIQISSEKKKIQTTNKMRNVEIPEKYYMVRRVAHIVANSDFGKCEL